MKRSHAKEMSVEIMVGAFIFMVLLALGFFTIILSYENFFTTYYSVEAKFEHVRGLRQGDNVFLRGVMIGRVKGLKVESDGVRVLASLLQEPHFREGYRIEILPSSVLGGQYLSIYEGPLSAPSIDGSGLLKGTPPVDLMEEATGTIREIRVALEEGGILNNLQNAVAQFSKISDDLAEGRGTLGKLIVDDSMYDTIMGLTKDLREVSGTLARGEGTIGKLIANDDIYNSLQEVTAQLSEIGGRLAEGKGTLGKLLSEDEALYDDLAASAASIREITGKMSRGEGTLGKLVVDDTLYEEAKLLLNELRATIDDFRETAPITTFTSIFFGAF